MKADALTLFAAAMLSGLANALSVRERLKLFEQRPDQEGEIKPFFRHNPGSTSKNAKPARVEVASGNRERKRSQGMSDLLAHFESRGGQNSPIKKGKERFDYKGQLADDPRGYQHRPSSTLLVQKKESDTSDGESLLKEDKREAAVAKRRRELEERIQKEKLEFEVQERRRVEASWQKAEREKEMRMQAAQRQREEIEKAEMLKKEEALRQARILEEERKRIDEEAQRRAEAIAEEDPRLMQERRREEDQQEKEQELREAIEMKEGALQRESAVKDDLQRKIAAEERLGRRRDRMVPFSGGYRRTNKPSSPGSESFGLGKEEQNKLSQIREMSRFQNRQTPPKRRMPRNVTINKVFGDHGIGSGGHSMPQSFERLSTEQANELMQKLSNLTISTTDLKKSLNQLMSAGFRDTVEPSDLQKAMQKHLNFGKVNNVAVIASAVCPIFFRDTRLNLSFPVNLRLDDKLSYLETICRACTKRGPNLQSQCQRWGLD